MPSSSLSDERKAEIQWSNPRSDLTDVPDDVLYALPPPLKPPFPETEEEARKRFWKSWAPGLIVGAVAAVWFARAKAKREWRGKLAAFPALGSVLEAIHFISPVDAVEKYDSSRLFSRLFMTISGDGSPVPADVVVAVVHKLGGEMPSLESSTVDASAFVDVVERSVASVNPATVFFTVQDEFGIVGLSPDVEDELMRLYHTLAGEKRHTSFTPDELNTLGDHLGISTDFGHAIKYLARARDAPPHALEDLKRVQAGVVLQPYEFLNYYADLLYGESDEAVMKHLRVFWMLRNA